MPSRVLVAVLAATGVAAVGSTQTPAVGEVSQVTIPGTDVEFSMVLVPGGTFTIGTAAGEPARDEDEGPTRTVTVSDFWIGVHEVRHEEYEVFRFRRLDDHVGAAPEHDFDADAISRPTPPYEDPSQGMGTSGHPASGMTRLAALHYARWLSEKTGRLYRLPTEAEWEYACRGGESGPAHMTAGGAELAWSAANSGGALRATGQREADALGLHDMLGNVAEWVMDTYDEAFYASLPDSTAAIDPVAPRTPRGRGVVRGGAYNDEPAALRCGNRFPESAAWKRRDPQVPKSRWWNTDAPHVGFRVVAPAREHTIEEIRAYWNEILET